MHTWLSDFCWVVPNACHFTKGEKLVFPDWVPRHMCLPDNSPDNSHYKNTAKRCWDRWINCLYHPLDSSCGISWGYTWFWLCLNQNVMEHMINLLALTVLTENFVNIWDFSSCCCCLHISYCHLCCCCHRHRCCFVVVVVVVVVIVVIIIILVIIVGLFGTSHVSHYGCPLPPLPQNLWHQLAF